MEISKERQFISGSTQIGHKFMVSTVSKDGRNKTRLPKTFECKGRPDLLVQGGSRGTDDWFVVEYLLSERVLDPE